MERTIMRGVNFNRNTGLSRYQHTSRHLKFEMRRMALSEWHYEAIDGEGTPMEIHFRLPLVLIYEQGVSYDEAFGQLAEDEEFLTHSDVGLPFRVGEPNCQQHVSVDLQLCLVVSHRDGSRAADKGSPPCRALFQQVRGINEAQV